MKNLTGYKQVHLSALFLGLICCTAVHATDQNTASSNDKDKSVSITVSTTATPASLDPDTVFSVIAAELAGQREQGDTSFDFYLQQAQKTKDATIAERAAQIAQQLRDPAKVMAAAEVWLSIAPQAIEPRLLMVQELTRLRRYNEATPHIEIILTQNPQADMQAIAMGAEDLSPAHLNELTVMMHNIAKKYPDNLSLNLTVARLFMIDKRWKEANLQLEKVLTKDPKNETAILMQADIALFEKKPDVALKKVRTAIEQGIGEKNIQLYYARLLVETNQPEQAKKQFQHITELYPNDYHLLYMLALLTLDSGFTNLSVQYFNTLIQVDHRADEAYYYLGQIAEETNSLDKALSYYDKISPNSEVYLAGLASASLVLLEQNQGDAAIERIQKARNLYPILSVDLYLIESDILMRQQKYPEAVALLSKAISQYSDELELVYARSLAAEKANNLTLAEKDLRFLIKKNPNDVSALNALGYTLADRTQRYQEALPLIEKALALRPDDPAIIDSMGWVQFRLGNLPQALEYLKKAYQMLPDTEIAGHLIEVLWVSGQPTEAQKIFDEVQKNNPDNQTLKNLMQRLQTPKKP